MRVRPLVEESELTRDRGSLLFEGVFHPHWCLYLSLQCVKKSSLGLLPPQASGFLPPPGGSLSAFFVSSCLSSLLVLSCSAVSVCSPLRYTHFLVEFIQSCEVGHLPDSDNNQISIFILTSPQNSKIVYLTTHPPHLHGCVWQAFLASPPP